MNFPKQFCAMQRTAGCREPFLVFDPKVCVPENRKGFAQTFLACTMLHVVKQCTNNPLLLEDPNHPLLQLFHSRQSRHGQNICHHDNSELHLGASQLCDGMGCLGGADRLCRPSFEWHNKPSVFHTSRRKQDQCATTRFRNCKIC
jgi:hypothetical protein